ncbi:MAG: rhombotarget lipoprotein [Pseudomonadota bacterium]
MQQRYQWVLLAFLSLFLTGCAAFWSEAGGRQTTVTSSLVDYLYPEGEKPTKPDGAIPRLELPLRVGIGFVPAETKGYSYSTRDLPENVKNELLETVKAAFVDLDYVEHIEVIPQTYLRNSKGFDGLGQIARLYDVDIMALVSYDQVSASTDNAASLLYWTIVGAYVIPATENTTQTFVDTAVFDMPTQRLLFRAPGANKRQSHSTAVDVWDERSAESVAGMRVAVDDMTTNLASELERFEQRLKDEPALAQVEWREGEGGGGAIGLTALLLLLSLALVCRRRSIAGGSPLLHRGLAPR